ncbi:AIM24 family protein [Paenibacillus enshidis]|uniref:AIM24 family protein n=1 Tax=Paenibacillus enshidis TaxID=1458439 RepID=A0ABV5AVP9_9BACL
MMWSDSLDFTVEKSGKTRLGSAMSGEGLVNVYRGTGMVWLAPQTSYMNSIFQSNVPFSSGAR